MLGQLNDDNYNKDNKDAGPDCLKVTKALFALPLQITIYSLLLGLIFLVNLYMIYLV